MIWKLIELKMVRNRFVCHFCNQSNKFHVLKKVKTKQKKQNKTKQNKTKKERNKNKNKKEKQNKKIQVLC